MYVGIDLGGTNVAAAIVDENGQILHRAQVPAEAAGGTQIVIGNIRKACDSLPDIGSLPLQSIGIGVPGIVDDEAGKIVFTPNLPLRNVDIASCFKEKYNCPVYLGNDANCAVLGETVAGSAKGARDVMLLTLGTGLGGGLVIGGRLVTGINGCAGEIGHMVTVAGGRACGCGRKGCWETYASASGLITTARGFLKEHRTSLLFELCGNDLNKVNGKIIFDAYRRGDTAAKLTVDLYIEHLACGIINLMNALEPEIISIGGGISEAWDCIEKPLTDAINAERFSRNSPDAKYAKLVRATLGNEAGLIGAAMLGKR